MATGRAYARTALVGNPSDGYGGAVMSVTFDAFVAEVHAGAAASTRVVPDSALVRAAAARFGRPAELRWRNPIPQAVGLGSSSALVVAALRALAALHDVALDPLELAAIARAVEREDLLIPGGHQDQVVQSLEGLLFMDFATANHERLPPELLPPLLIAYLPHAAQNSAVAHRELRSNAQRPDVRERMAQLALIARDAREALLRGDHEAFAHAVDATFDARAQLMALDPVHVEMITRARGCGASANYCGSGGAVVCVCRDAMHRERVAGELAELGAVTLVPKLT